MFVDADENKIRLHWSRCDPFKMNKPNFINTILLSLPHESFRLSQECSFSQRWKWHLKASYDCFYTSIPCLLNTFDHYEYFSSLSEVRKSLSASNFVHQPLQAMVKDKQVAIYKFNQKPLDQEACHFITIYLLFPCD